MKESNKFDEIKFESNENLQEGLHQESENLRNIAMEKFQKYKIKAFIEHSKDYGDGEICCMRFFKHEDIASNYEADVIEYQTDVNGDNMNKLESANKSVI